MVEFLIALKEIIGDLTILIYHCYLSQLNFLKSRTLYRLSFHILLSIGTDTFT